MIRILSSEVQALIWVGNVAAGGLAGPQGGPGWAGCSPGTGTRTPEPCSLRSPAGLAILPPGLVQCPQAPLGRDQLGQPLGVLPARSSVPSTCRTQQGGVSAHHYLQHLGRGRGTAAAGDSVLNQ